jgi:hypothetical protein
MSVAFRALAQNGSQPAADEAIDSGEGVPVGVLEVFDIKFYAIDSIDNSPLYASHPVELRIYIVSISFPENVWISLTSFICPPIY